MHFRIHQVLVLIFQRNYSTSISFFEETSETLRKTCLNRVEKTIQLKTVKTNCFSLKININ